MMSESTKHLGLNKNTTEDGQSKRRAPHGGRRPITAEEQVNG